MGLNDCRKSLLRALLAAAALAVASLPSMAAERAVGLEARGVDPMAALHNASGLDVRDAEGHPVSATVIAQQLKAASVQAAAAASYASRLPRAKAVALILEFLKIARESFRAGWPSLPFDLVWALPVSARRDPSRGLALLAFALASSALASSRRTRKSAVALSSRSRLDAPLRC